jgi:hypothetical protein
MNVEEIAGTSITYVSFHNDEAKYNTFKADTLQLHVPASVGSVLSTRTVSRRGYEGGHAAAARARERRFRPVPERAQG